MSRRCFFLTTKTRGAGEP